MQLSTNSHPLCPSDSSQLSVSVWPPWLEPCLWPSWSRSSTPTTPAPSLIPRVPENEPVSHFVIIRKSKFITSSGPIKQILLWIIKMSVFYNHLIICRCCPYEECLMYILNVIIHFVHYVTLLLFSNNQLENIPPLLNVYNVNANCF